MAKRGKKSKAEEQAELGRKMREQEAATEVIEVPEAVVPASLVAEDQAVEAEQDAADTAANTAEDAAEAEVEEDNKKANSVVAVKFKEKYLANAREKGIPGKAAKRSNWDWLAENLAKLCLDEKHKISIGKFKEILDANGVDHSKWTNQNKGWEGRFRMTGRVALQKVVANNGVMKTAEGDLTPPAEFIARFKTKE